MASGNNFQELRNLPADVLAEVVREGELRVEAQLATATAADQRALTFAGFQIASATAALAGGIALIVGDQKDFTLALLAGLFSCALLIAAGIALSTVRPKEFHFPGNRPGNWLPSQWAGYGIHKLNLTQARIEQASCLETMIADNAASASSQAKLMHQSMDITIWAAAIAAIGLLTIVILRVPTNVRVQDPAKKVLNAPEQPKLWRHHIESASCSGSYQAPPEQR